MASSMGQSKLSLSEKFQIAGSILKPLCLMFKPPKDAYETMEYMLEFSLAVLGGAVKLMEAHNNNSVLLNPPFNPHYK